VEHRRHAQLAARRAQSLDGRRLLGLLNRQNSYNVVPSVALGFDTNLDPARDMFNTTNFPERGRPPS
jgi:hypothetical protein